MVMWFSSSLYGQQEMMINGGFEDYVLPSPPPITPGLVDCAVGWHALANSPDLLHPMTSTNPFGGAAYVPHSGDGHGHFWSQVVSGSDGGAEIMYGTTHSLTSGQTYKVSFWLFNNNGNPLDISVSAYLSHDLPSPTSLNPFVFSVTPQITFIPKGSYTRYTFCYTATQSGTHYLTIGSFTLPEATNWSTNVMTDFNVDDVSVTSIAGLPVNASSVSIASPNVCVGNTVLVDGSASTADTEHEWSVYQLNGSSETLIYSGTLQSGAAGTFNVSTAMTGHSVEPGDCYRVYLRTYGACPADSHVDFCYDDPDIDFLNNGSPVCLNAPVDLQVTGDNGWTYLWKQGGDTLSNGIGQKMLTVTPTTIGTKLYSVTVTTAAGCTHTELYSLSVQNTTNVAPWFDGINGSGEFTAYVTSGNGIGFSSTLFNDNAGELLTVNENTSGIPFPVTLIRPFQSGEQMQFWWQTTGVPPGTYSFLLITDDHNTCSPGIDTVKFIIIVICDHCPTCIGYENRSAATTPLPPETKVGKCIEAGMYQNVIVGNNPVLFQAGNYILLGNYFDSGSNGSFEAVIDPSTCVSDCQDCCVDWDGFTYDTPPIVTHMNLDDSDPTNDFFYLTDVNHPFCAFNAKGFHLTIYDDDENFIYETEYYGEECCPFESPSPEHPMTHSSIFWDGLRESSTHQQVHAFDGIYYWKVTLYGCNGESIVLNERIHYGLFTGMAQAPGGAMTEQQLQAAEIQRELDKRFEEIGLMPNPASSTVNITGFADNELLSYQLFDERGLMISKKEQLSQHSFDVSRLSDGTYYCRIYKDGQYIVKKFVKI